MCTLTAFTGHERLVGHSDGVGWERVKTEKVCKFRHRETLNICVDGEQSGAPG